MSRGRALLAILAAAFLAAPAHATSVTVVMTGTWFDVDPSVTDIEVNDPFTVTLTYDDSAEDQDNDGTIGSYLLPSATSSLVLETGDYTFTLMAGEDIIFGVGDNLNGNDDFAFFADDFTSSGPITTGYGYMNPIVADSTQTAHDSDALADLPWSVSVYNSPNLGMYFLIDVTGEEPLQLFGDFTEFSVLPEPSTLALALLGGAALIAFRRRG